MFRNGFRPGLLVVAVCAALGGLGHAASAEGAQLICDFRQDGSRKGTPERVVVDLRAGEETAPVRDGYQAAMQSGPVEGRVERDDAKSLVFRRKIKKMRFDNGMITNLAFSLNWSKASGAARISGQPGGVPTKFTGTGRCKLDHSGGTVEVAPQDRLPKLPAGPVRG